MESIDDSVKETRSRRIVDRRNVVETARRSLAESDVAAAAARREGKTETNRKNSSRDETAEANNNGTLKETTASESRCKGGDDIGKRDGSTRENEGDALARVMSADRLGETHGRSLRETLAPSPSSTSDGAGREGKNSGEIGRAAMIGARRRKPFRDIIGKREQRREELERMEGNLRQRLDMLECSIPAVLVWNVWRMAQGAPVCKIKRILEKQFKDVAACAPACRSTPSRHYDCRVREAEAERKLALRKMEEARALWTDKYAALEERKGRLEEAKRIQQEQSNMMERLNEEAQALREATEKERADESCQHGECGDTRCKRRWLDKLPSVTSIQYEDIQCLERLQQLAEEEIIVKRDIAELERREEAYMRTLQQADELWSKVETDAAGTASELQRQLDMKTAANQRLADRVCELEDALEKCRARMAACRTELEKFVSIEKVETVIGRDDDVAQVADKEVAVRAKVVHRPVGRPDDVATVKDDEVSAEVEVADATTLARVEIADEEISARTVLIDVVDEDVWAKPVTADLAVDRQIDLVPIADTASAIRPEDFAYEQQKLKEVRRYLAQLGSLEELYEDDGEACPPDFACSGVVVSPTGMTDEELIALGVVETAEPTERIDGRLLASDEEEEERERRRSPPLELAKEKNDVADYIAEEEKTTVRIPGVETEGVVTERIQERSVGVADLPVREVVTRRRIMREEEEDVSPVTMPDERRVRAPEAKKINDDRDIAIQRDKILSWMDAIDKIRATIARHPDCHEAKEDADNLAEMIGAHVGIKPKEVADEEDLTTITLEDKQRKIIEKDEMRAKIEAAARGKLNNGEIKFVPEVPTELPKIELIAKIQVESVMSPAVTSEVTEVNSERGKELKTNKQRVTIKTKLEDELMALEKKEAEPETEDGSIPFPYTEEATAEVKAPMEPVVRPELLPNLTNEEISAGMESSEPISIENSSQPPANLIEKDANSDAAPPIESVSIDADIRKVEIEEKTRIEETVAEEAEVSPREMIEAYAINRDLIVEESTVKITENEKEMIHPADKGETLTIRKMENAEYEIMPERVERPEVKADMPKEEVVEREAAEKAKTDEVLGTRVETSESIVEEGAREKFVRIPQIGEIKRADVAAGVTPPHTEIVETRKTAQAPPIAAVRETERAGAEETVPTADIKEVEELVVDKVSPVVDLAEIEKSAPSEPPVANGAAEVPDVVEEKIEVEETRLIPDVKEDEVEKPSLSRAVTEEEVGIEKSVSITDTIAEKIDIAKPTADEVKEEKIEMEEPSPAAEILTEEPIEMEKPSPATDAIIEKKIETARPIAEEKIETIQPAIEPPLSTVEKEVEKIGAVEKVALEMKIPKEEEEDEEMEETPAKITPPIKSAEEVRGGEESPPMDKEEIVAEITMPPEPTELAEDKEREVPSAEKKLEFDDVEVKIPDAETKPVEVAATTPATTTPTIDRRLAAQPYFVVAKIEEREVLHVISAMETFASCTAGSTTTSTTHPTRPPVEIARTDVLQQTELVQITTQTVSTAVPLSTPPSGIVSERAESPGLKGSTEIATGDRRPEITGRKTLWHKRLKDQSTVTTASAGSQTDRTSRVSHDRVERQRARVPTDELLRSIKIAAAGLTLRGDAEREIRTINYGRRSDEAARAAICDCCLCGRTASVHAVRSRLPAQPRIAAKTATPPATSAAGALRRDLIPTGTDRVIPYDRLCRDCKAKIRDGMPRERMIRKISCDRGGCATSGGKSCRAAPRRSAIERRDQGCLAKIPKRKADAIEHKRKNVSIPTDTGKSEVEPFSPSCICFKQTEKTGAGPSKKGNCHCAS